MPTLTQARDEMLAAFYAQWKADTPAVTPAGTVPPVFWDGIPEEDAPPQDAPWARVVIRHGTSAQASLAGDSGSRRFERLGIIVVQVFVPLVLTDPPTLGGNLAAVARRAYEGKTTDSGIWFRDVRAYEVGPDGPWYQWNVTAAFRYDEFV